MEKMNHLVTMYGDEVFMLTNSQGKHPVPYQLVDGVRLADLGIQFHLQYRKRGLMRLWDGHRRTRLFEQRLSEQIERIQPDIIVCTTADPVYSIAKVKGAIPLIVESHSICSRTLGETSSRQRYVAHLLKRGLKHASCWVAMTEQDACEWCKLGLHVEVIPDMVHLNDGALSSFTRKRVIFVGRFDYQKRPLEIIHIWQRVFPQFPDWHLDIYGDGEQRREVEALASELDMNIHVHMPTGEIFECYRNSSILVSTSLFEPFGLVIPEAMSCGLPVVAYDCPYGPSTLIADGENGFLVENLHADAFASQLSLLMSDENLRQRMGQAAAKSAQAYSAEKIMPMWQQLFWRQFPWQVSDR